MKSQPTSDFFEIFVWLAAVLAYLARDRDAVGVGDHYGNTLYIYLFVFIDMLDYLYIYIYIYLFPPITLYCITMYSLIYIMLYYSLLA